MNLQFDDAIFWITLIVIIGGYELTSWLRRRKRQSSRGGARKHYGRYGFNEDDDS